MSPAAWAALAAIVGPGLVFITYLLSRPTTQRTAQAEQMTSMVTNALSTTEIMQTLLQPMEQEIHELRGELQTVRAETAAEIGSLRRHIMTLEQLIISLGGSPPPMPFTPFGYPGMPDYDYE